MKINIMKSYKKSSLHLSSKKKKKLFYTQQTPHPENLKNILSKKKNNWENLIGQIMNNPVEKKKKKKKDEGTESHKRRNKN